MSAITPIEPLREAHNNLSEEKRLVAEAEKEKATTEQFTPAVQDAAHAQDSQKTLQGLQYTGKGSFIDKVF